MKCALLLLITAASLSEASRMEPVLRAPESAARLRNPFDGDANAVRAGAKLFRQECAACHGSRGQGRPHRPPLATRSIADAPDGAIFWVLRTGTTRGMPSFADLPEQRRWQIIAYLRSMPVH